MSKIDNRTGRDADADRRSPWRGRAFLWTPQRLDDEALDRVSKGQTAGGGRY